MKSSKATQIIVISIVTVLGVIIGVGNGCSRSAPEEYSASSTSPTSSTTAPTTAGTSSDIEVIPGAKTVSLVYSKQVLDQLSACSGLAVPSDKTLAMYEQKKGAISTYGSANTVTSPMMMAVTSIAGEICNDLIIQEAASVSGRLFTGFNMTAAILPNTSQLSDTISKFAVSCWQRNESSSERQALLDMVMSSVAPNEAFAGRKSALMLCTSMLSSLDAILN